MIRISKTDLEWMLSNMKIEEVLQHLSCSRETLKNTIKDNKIKFYIGVN